MFKKILFAAAMTAALVANGALPAPASAQAPAFQPTRFTVTVEGTGPDLILIPGLTSSRHVWDQAVASLPNDDAWLPAALLVQGASALLLGEVDRGDAILEQAVERATRNGATETHAIAVGERSLVAATRGDLRAADDLAEEAQRVVEQGELGEYPSSALALAASARSKLRHGQWDRARRQLGAATQLTPHLSYALPWLALQTRLELGDAYVTLRDRDAAQQMLEEARGILAARPSLGVLAEGVERLEREITAMPSAQDSGSSGLTRAELRLLPMLSTHLSFKEIGERLHVSRNTIKTQAISVYRKLGVSSRSEAVAVAADLGLVEATEARSEHLELDERIASVAP